MKKGRPPVIRECPKCGAKLTAREMLGHKCQVEATPKELTYERIDE